MARSIAQSLRRMLLGGFLGFAAYCSLVMVEELPDLVFRGYYDWEGTVMSCLLPIGPLEIFPLFSKGYWADIPLWVNLDSIAGAALVVIGICLGARWEPRPKRGQRMFFGGLLGLFTYGTFTLLITGEQFSKTSPQKAPMWSNFVTLAGAFLIILGTWLGAKWKSSSTSQPGTSPDRH